MNDGDGDDGVCDGVWIAIDFSNVSCLHSLPFLLVVDNPFYDLHK